MEPGAAGSSTQRRADVAAVEPDIAVVEAAAASTAEMDVAEVAVGTALVGPLEEGPW